MERVIVRISGKVQGVGYRFFAIDEAVVRGLVGYARNLSNGDVEVVSEGPRPVLEDFVAALRKGPRASRVDDVRPEWQPARREFEDFGIRY
jgi:acylphosphatase